jgi:hypothetical protein
VIVKSFGEVVSLKSFQCRTGISKLGRRVEMLDHRSKKESTDPDFLLECVYYGIRMGLTRSIDVDSFTAVRESL